MEYLEKAKKIYQTEKITRQNGTESYINGNEVYLIEETEMFPNSTTMITAQLKKFNKKKKNH